MDPGSFEDAGYTIPETWDELMALSDQMVADGGVPWCIGIESSGATGWVGTDWIEDIMLRTRPAKRRPVDEGRAEVRFTRGQKRLRDREQNLDEPGLCLRRHHLYLTVPLAITDSFVRGSPACGCTDRPASSPTSSPREPKSASTSITFTCPPSTCLRQTGARLRQPGQPGQRHPRQPRGHQVHDHRRVVKAEVEAGNFIAPHWTPAWTGIQRLQRGYAEILAAANTFRFDGSDLMPGAVGAGSFWTGIVDWVSGEDLDSVLQAIDASWPQKVAVTGTQKVYSVAIRSRAVA